MRLRHQQPEARYVRKTCFDEWLREFLADQVGHMRPSADEFEDRTPGGAATVASHEVAGTVAIQSAGGRNDDLADIAGRHFTPKADPPPPPELEETLPRPRPAF